MKPHPDNQHLYFIKENNTHAIKIGLASNVRTRLATINSSTPATVELIGTIPHAGRSLEKRLHHRFADHRIKGEWFASTPRLLRLIGRISTTEIPTPITPDSDDYGKAWRRRNPNVVRAYNKARRTQHDPRACPICTQTFTPTRSDQTYCSRSCRDHKSYLQRNGLTSARRWHRTGERQTLPMTGGCA